VTTHSPLKCCSRPWTTFPGDDLARNSGKVFFEKKKQKMSLHTANPNMDTGRIVSGAGYEALTAIALKITGMTETSQGHCYENAKAMCFSRPRKFSLFIEFNFVPMFALYRALADVFGDSLLLI
jgi:hypothetical protein